MNNDLIEPLEGMQKVILDLANGVREPENDEERELLAEIKEAEEKGYMLDLPFDWNDMSYLIDDRNEVYQVYSSKCTICEHFQYSGFNCIAFPDGIHTEILNGNNDHSRPLPEQRNEIVFSEK